MKKKDDDGSIISLVDEPSGRHYFFSDDDREFSPSERIQDAWKVVEKLREDGYAVRLTLEDDEPIEALITKNDGSGDLIYGKGETTPLAICKAALKTVGVGIEN